MADPFAQYDVVRIASIADPAVATKATAYQRGLRVGDLATLLDVYVDPPGYELECSDSNGKTVWLGSFAPDDLRLERVWDARTKKWLVR